MMHARGLLFWSANYALTYKNSKLNVLMKYKSVGKISNN